MLENGGGGSHYFIHYLQTFSCVPLFTVSPSYHILISVISGVTRKITTAQLQPALLLYPCQTVHHLHLARERSKTQKEFITSYKFEMGVGSAILQAAPGDSQIHMQYKYVQEYIC